MKEWEKIRSGRWEEWRIEFEKNIEGVVVRGLHNGIYSCSVYVGRFFPAFKSEANKRSVNEGKDWCFDRYLRLVKLIRDNSD